MGEVRRLFRCVNFLIVLIIEGSHERAPVAEEAVVVWMNSSSAMFKCQKPVILRCNAGVDSFVNWYIDTNFSAQCITGLKCDIYNNFTGRYLYGYNSTSGYSDLRIDPVVLADDGRKYECTDGTPHPLSANVTLPTPTNSSHELSNKTSDAGSEITFIVNTTCTIAQVKITWYIMAENGSISQTIKESYSSRTVCQDGDCIVPNKSVWLSSALELEKIPSSNAIKKRSLEDGTGNQFGVTVSYDSLPFDIPIKGRYKIKDMPKDKMQNEELSVTVIIIISFFIPAGVAIFAISLACFIRKRKNKATDAPETPVRFELVRDSVAEESATFRCISRPYQPGNQDIVLCCQTENGIHKVEKIQTINGANDTFVEFKISNLNKGQEYDCFVFSRSDNRRSMNSSPIRIKTLGLPDAPTDFKVVKVESNLMHLSWIPGRYRMNQQTFYLELINVKNGDIIVEPVRMVFDRPLTHTVEPLPAGTTFMVSLRAENSVGRSDVVGPIEVTTKGNPDRPLELNVVGVTPSSIAISWRPGIYRRQTQTFVIDYGRNNKNGSNIKWKQKTKDDDGQPVMNYTLSGLKAGQIYTIVIFAKNDIGVSQRTRPLLAKTQEEDLDD